MTTSRFPAIPDNPKLDALIRAAVAKVNAMSPSERRSMHEAQRRSWVIGEMLLDHPEMSREEAERIYEEVR